METWKIYFNDTQFFYDQISPNLLEIYGTLQIPNHILIGIDDSTLDQSLSKCNWFEFPKIQVKVSSCHNVKTLLYSVIRDWQFSMEYSPYSVPHNIVKDLNSFMVPKKKIMYVVNSTMVGQKVASWPSGVH